MTEPPLPGARITQGPMDWQVIQRRLNNNADIPLAGTSWCGESDGRVELRIVQANNGFSPSPALDWASVDQEEEGNWRHTLRAVPAGGPYRIETRVRTPDGTVLTGDRLHHIGVGDLWVIAGQSNAVGFARGPVEDPLDPRVHLFRAREQWGMADHPLHDPTGSRHPANRDRTCNGHSPWLAFARSLADHLCIPIGLIPAALGGSGLCQWDPEEENPELFHNMLSFVRAACSMVDHDSFDSRDGGAAFLPNDRGEAGRIAGVLWYQGCSDTHPNQSTTYLQRFTRFMEGVRTALDSPGLPFITVQLNRTWLPGANAEGWSNVREAQRQAARMLPFVSVVPSIDLGLTDVIHIDADGNQVIARRAARAALGMVYGHDVLWRAPDLAGAGCENGDRTRVILYVENVASELWCPGGLADTFTLSDCEGPVDIEHAEILCPDRVRLTLSRALAGEACVSHASGSNPPVRLFDRERRPLVAFSRVPIED